MTHFQLSYIFHISLQNKTALRSLEELFKCPYYSPVCLQECGVGIENKCWKNNNPMHAASLNLSLSSPGWTMHELWHFIVSNGRRAREAMRARGEICDH
jgi:hypothetical protein